MSNEAKNPNPKDSIGSTKVPVHLWPETATVVGCMGLLDGAAKYGRANWRSAGVRASIYYDACKRHLNAWFEGEEVDPDSGLPHMAHALACLAIIVDAEAAGKLIDDRNYPGGYRRLINLLTPHVLRLQTLHGEKHPHHFTINDKEKPDDISSCGSTSEPKWRGTVPGDVQRTGEPGSNCPRDGQPCGSQACFFRCTGGAGLGRADKAR